MVLGDLGSQLTSALRKLNSAPVLDQELIDAVIKEMCNALMKADVNIKQVMQMKKNISTALALEDSKENTAFNKRKQIQRLVMSELVSMLNAEKKPHKPKKNQTSVFMMVGLQGAGKTTTCTKLAHHYARRGWKTCLVCADTFRAGAFDQLRQAATKINVPFYGSYTENDPVQIAREGVQKFRAEKYEIIIVDTSGRHRQEESLFAEMDQVRESVSPDECVFVMDSHIGQACFSQAEAFGNVCDIGSVIVTKLDGHAKGGGALSAVAATGAPIIFLGTGEHFDEMQAFEAEGFVSKLLGLGDLKGLMGALQDVLPQENADQMVERIAQGQFTLRDLYEQLKQMTKMGPLSNIMSMIPGAPNSLPQGDEEAAQKRVKTFLVILDSCTNDELDGKKGCEIEKSESRVLRITRGAGVHPGQVAELIAEYKRFAKMIGNLGKSGLMKNGGANMQQQLMRNPQALVKQLGSAMDPRVLQKMGGAGNMAQMLKSIGGMEGMMEQMGDMFGGKGGVKGGPGKRR